MRRSSRGTRILLSWVALAVALTVPIAIAATSPLLQWREPIYIAAGLAGVVGLGLLLVQPLLASVVMPGLSRPRSRRLHALVGPVLVLAVIVHVGGLWLTSPPDVVDVLLFQSPTPFSVWGVIAMWAVFAAALLAGMRRRWRVRPRYWRIAHKGLAGTIVTGTVVHAWLIEGTMGTVSKAALCALVIAATAWALFEGRLRRGQRRVRAER